MNKERADQLIRCVKECWWRAGLLLLLLFGFALFALHGWPSADWGVVWGFLGAVASGVTGCAATVIAYEQKKANDQFSLNKDWVARRRAHHLLNEVYEKISDVVGDVEGLLKDGGLPVSDWVNVLQGVVNIREKLPQDYSSIDSGALLGVDLSSALFDLERSISNLNKENEKIDFEQIQNHSRGKQLVAIFLNNELIPLIEVAINSERCFKCLGLGALQGVMEKRLECAVDGLKSIWIPNTQI